MYVATPAPGLLTLHANTIHNRSHSFCCDGLAAEYVAAQNKQELPTDKETVDPAIIGLAVYAGIATMAAVGATVFAVQKSTRLELHHNRGSKMGGGVELSMLDNGL